MKRFLFFMATTMRLVCVFYFCENHVWYRVYCIRKGLEL